MEHHCLLYVGGLDSRVDENTLNAAFIPFGPIKEVEIPRDQVTKSNRGFGFVRFHDIEDAQAARDNMNDAELYGRTLKVDVAKQQKTFTTKHVSLKQNLGMNSNDSLLQAVWHDREALRRQQQRQTEHEESEAAKAVPLPAP